MASPIEVTPVLCDAAQVDAQAGKVHMLGAGWSVTTSPTTPSAAVVMLGIPWDRSNRPIHVSLALVDQDGKPVTIPGPNGQTEVKIEADVEVGRPPGVPSGVMLDANLAPVMPPLPLEPGRYSWQLDLTPSGESASRSFPGAVITRFCLRPVLTSHP